MIPTLEVRSEDRQALIAFVRILGPDGITGRADYAVGAVESARARGGQAGSAGCVVEHDHRLGIWALLERTCAELKKTHFLAQTPR